MNRNKLRRLLQAMARLSVGAHLPMAAAGLSYFLTLSFFPMLICLYTMLGRFFPAEGDIRRFLTGLIPPETLSLIGDYLRYVSGNFGTPMLVMALAVMVTSSSAGFRILDRTIGELHGCGRSAAATLIRSVCSSLVFLAAIYFAVLLVVTGKWFLNFLDSHLMAVNVSDSWGWARFFLLFLLLFVMLLWVYRVTAPKNRPVHLVPGAALGAVMLAAVSILFSASVSASARYPLVYGSLASIVIMMFWLYACSMAALLGSALNAALDQTAGE